MASIVDICEQPTTRWAVEDRVSRFDARSLVESPAITPLPRRPHPATKYGGVSVVVPCYNEQGMIAATVRQITDVMKKTNRPYELLIVDDGSNEATRCEIASCAYEPHLRVLHNERNRGYGFSLKRAIAEAQYETVVITDSDGTYPNRRIPQLLDSMDGVDMVVGSRTGLNVNIPFSRRPAKWALRKLAGYLTESEIPDLNSGLRVMKRSLIRRFLPLLPDGFSFTTTITLALLTHGHQVRFLPIDYAKRVGRSSIRPFRDTMSFLSLMVRTVLYFRPLKVFMPASAIVFALAVGVALISKLAFGQVADVISVTLVIASVHLLAIGLLADLIDKRSLGFS